MFGLQRLGEIEMAIDDDHAYGVSAFALSWAVALTMVRTKKISKEDLLTTLRRLKAGPYGHAVDELIKLVDDIKIGEGSWHEDKPSERNQTSPHIEESLS